MDYDWYQSRVAPDYSEQERGSLPLASRIDSHASVGQPRMVLKSPEGHPDKPKVLAGSTSRKRPPIRDAEMAPLSRLSQSLYSLVILPLVYGRHK